MQKSILVAICLLLALTGTAVAAEKKDKLSIGFVYVSPVGNEGFSYSHDVARRQLEEDPNITTSFVENVQEGPDAERVIKRMARSGIDVIITCSFGFMGSTLKVASEHPDQTFLHCSGYRTSPNMSTFFGRIYQSRYLTGLVAGKMTESNIIGYVAAYPIPEVIRGINAFTLGVREVNPDAEVRVVWTKTWFDPVTEKEAGKSLVDVGADVLAQHQDSPAVQEAALEKGVYSIGYHSDMSAYAPGKHLVAAIWNWYPFYARMAREIREGTWKSDSYWYGMAEDIVDISDFGQAVPEDVQALVLERKAAIKDGSLVVFSGPVRDQNGNIRIPEGEVLPDQELLSMNWFVEGVVGTTQ